MYEGSEITKTILITEEIEDDISEYHNLNMNAISAERKCISTTLEQNKRIGSEIIPSHTRKSLTEKVSTEGPLAF